MHIRENSTPFQDIYDGFFNIITDDMYLEWTKEETEADVKNIFLASFTKFKYPRFKLYDYEVIELPDGEKIIGDKFNFALTPEEITIFANLMAVEWITRQMATTDVTRQKYNSSDFSMTSQAAHLGKLQAFKVNFSYSVDRLQNLYQRRKISADGVVTSNFLGLGGKNGN